MKLAIKCNVILLAIFGLGLGTAFFIARNYLLNSAREQVLEQARLMMETSSSTRKYTSEHIRPILDKYQRHSAAFYPESVPAFSATQMFAYLRRVYPEYTYKEATLNPTNPSDRAVDWEADIISLFRNPPALREFIGEREAPNGRLLYLARPIQAVESCLECHSTPAAAPPAMVTVYGRDNGFGWKLNEIIGAQIVSVPLSIAQNLARQALWRFMGALAGFAVVTLLLLNVALATAVIRPVMRISAAAIEVSKGNLSIGEVPVTGKDEIAMLADSLNRIQRSLVKAIRSLEHGEP